MSASVTDRARAGARGRTATVPVPREADPPARERKRGTGQRATPRTATQRAGTQRAQVATDRAYARRDQRLRRLVGGPRPQRAAAPTGRAKFVLLVMLLLLGGLAATLWLSTAAAADSYRLQDAKSTLTTLSQQDESLHREVAQLASAPELAKQAEQLGMVRVHDPARLVVGPDGTVTVVGKPQAAPVPAPPPAPTAPADGAQAGAGLPAAPDAAATPPADPQDGADQDGTAPQDPAPQAATPTTTPTTPTTPPGSGTGTGTGTAGHTAGGGTD